MQGKELTLLSLQPLSQPVFLSPVWFPFYGFLIVVLSPGGEVEAVCDDCPGETQIGLGVWVDLRQFVQQALVSLHALGQTFLTACKIRIVVSCGFIEKFGVPYCLE